MSRRIQHGDHHVFDLEPVSFGDSLVFESALRRLRGHDRCSRPGGQIQMPRYKVGVQMRLQDMGNLHAHVLGRLQINLDIPARIDDRTRGGPGQQIRAMGQALHKKLLYKHTETPSNFILELV